MLKQKEMNQDKVIVYITYTKTDTSFFDTDYYNTIHIPLILELWKPYGLLSAEAFYPADSTSRTVLICECVFKNNDAFEKAIASAEVERLGADVANFTNLPPQQYVVKK